MLSSMQKEVGLRLLKQKHQLPQCESEILNGKPFKPFLQGRCLLV